MQASFTLYISWFRSIFNCSLHCTYRVQRYIYRSRGLDKIPSYCFWHAWVAARPQGTPRGAPARARPGSCTFARVVVNILVALSVASWSIFVHNQNLDDATAQKQVSGRAFGRVAVTFLVQFSVIVVVKLSLR